MASQQFVETAHAKIYSAHRPDVPPEIAEKNTELKVDCVPMKKPLFAFPYRTSSVHTYKISNDILSLLLSSLAFYRVQEAENLPFETCSVQLVTACASLHWFNLELFFNEVRRILVPGGVLVVYTYHSLRPFFDCPLKMKEVNCLYNQIYEELYPYWPKEVHLSLEKYESVQFPFEESNKIPDIRQFFFGRFSDLTGFVESLSAFQIMKKTDISKAENFISRFGSRLHDLLAVPDQQDCKMIKLYRDFYCIMCRKK
ncbi:putative methyltransferase-like protein [Argiope bruennichi]|uniref:Putative methyltransferase-like protein n=1 Tax=Argiope bruennichi TaxID=94029 RepID=A0A8T0FWL9_ARGBR|nr:putative methyltransferase-like protein [Argiope bruennichi]